MLVPSIVEDLYPSVVGWGAFFSSTAPGSHLMIPRATSLRMIQRMGLERQKLERSWILGDMIGLLN